MAGRKRIGAVAAALSEEARAAARMARELGFGGLQFDATTSALDLTALSGSGRREFRQMMTQQDQAIVALRTDGGVKGMSAGGDVDALLWRWDRVLETAAGLEARLVCLELGPLPAPEVQVETKAPISADLAGIILIPEPKPQAAAIATVPFDAVFAARVDEALVELGRRADRYGVMVAMRSELASLAALERAVRAARCPWFGIDLDPVAILADGIAASEVFSSIGSLIRHVRGRDAVGGAGGRTKPVIVGRGSTDWAGLLALLDEAGFEGWITIDPIELTERAAGAGAGLKYLRGI
ncbi:MAG: TIM barrel protein [Tepidisphaeraceae bacterium]|jgi:sugar phosphate isomerase/epimerase